MEKYYIWRSYYGLQKVLRLHFVNHLSCREIAGKPDETTKVTIFIVALTYSDYFYAEGMTECDIRNWIRVNNNALTYFGGVTPTITPDNCKVGTLQLSVFSR
jgi:transposase